MSTNIFHIKTHVFPGQYIREYPSATLENQEEPLQLHIKQYLPRDPSRTQTGAVTIIAAHANGFVKELYEPMWEELYQRLKKHGFSIGSIWIADMVHQGQSFVLNENKLGNDPSWLDHSRDLLYMINHFSKDMPRPLVGIGHSIGGGQLVNLSVMHPRLLSSVILIDPPIMPAFSTMGYGHSVPAQMSAFRNDLWPSRAEATASFKKNKFYQSWDERVFDRWIEYGLRDLPTALYPEYQRRQDPKGIPITLTTTKHQEVFSFIRPKPNFEGQAPGEKLAVNRQTHPDLITANPFPFYRPESKIIFHNLAHIRPAVLFMFGGKSPLSNPEARDLKMKLTGTGAGGNGGAAQGRVQQAFFEKVGHLIPFEVVNECAQSSADFLASELQRWQKEEAEFEQAWEGKGEKERTTLTKKWERHLGEGRKGKSAPKL